MNSIKETCKNCQHQRQADGEPHFRLHCLVWNKTTYFFETCQHFQVAERLLPTLEEVQAFWNPSPQ